MDECQGGLEKGGDVESVGRNEGAVSARGWGEAVVGLGDDGNRLIGLHVDETRDRRAESLLDRVVDGFDFFLDGARVTVVESEHWLRKGGVRVCFTDGFGSE